MYTVSKTKLNFIGIQELNRSKLNFIKIRGLGDDGL